MPRQSPAGGSRGPARILAGLISNARNGHSRSLVVRGEPGIGKTALLRDVTGARHRRSARLEWTVTRLSRSIPFSALHRIVMPLACTWSAAATSSAGTADRDRRLGRARLPTDSWSVSGLLELLAEAGQSAPVVCLSTMRTGSTRSRWMFGVRGPKAAGRAGRDVVRDARRSALRRQGRRDPGHAARRAGTGGGDRTVDRLVGREPSTRSRPLRSHGRPGAIRWR